MVYIHSQDDRYGNKIGGVRYKKWTPPEPLSVSILKMVSLGVAFTAASILSPTFLFQVAKKYLKYKHGEAKYYEYLDRKTIQKSLSYLKKRHFVAFPAKGTDGQFTITKPGQKRLSDLELEAIAIKKIPWDGKWRLLTFDIPEEKSSRRHLIRRKLKSLGFYHFQRSVFVLPYPCKTEVGRIKEILGVENNVHVLTADRFDGDEALVKHYHLKYSGR